MAIFQPLVSCMLLKSRLEPLHCHPDDILHARRKTMGVTEYTFNPGSGVRWHLYDLDGALGQRPSWVVRTALDYAQASNLTIVILTALF